MQTTFEAEIHIDKRKMNRVLIEQTLLTGDFEAFYTKAQSYLQKARG